MILPSSQIRQEKRAARRALAPRQRRARSAQIIQHILASPEYQSSQSLAVFRAFDGEVDLFALCQQAWEEQKRVYLPVILGAGKPLQFARWQPEDVLIVAEYGIERPDTSPDTWLLGFELDLVLTPLVAFDDQLNRLGMGAGYYDRTFAHKLPSANRAITGKPINPFLMGVAYECQRIAALSVQPWDVPLEALVTEFGVYQRSSSR